MERPYVVKINNFFTWFIRVLVLVTMISQKFERANLIASFIVLDMSSILDFELCADGTNEDLMLREGVVLPFVP